MTGKFDDPIQVELAFYEAFQNGDAERMNSVWAPHDAVVCIHPMGPILSGREAIQKSWQEIFEGSYRPTIELSLFFETIDNDNATRCVIEQFSIPDRPIQSAPILATNAYQRIDGSWYMTLHHASPSPAAPVSADVIPITAATRTKH